MHINFQQKLGQKFCQNRAHKSIGKNGKLHKCATRNSNLETGKGTCSKVIFLSADIQTEFEIYRHRIVIRFPATVKRTYFHKQLTDGQTDRQTDCLTNRRRVRQ